MQKVTKNTFEKGLNSDIDPNKLPPTAYTDAHNVELVGDGDFFALRNVKGTTLKEQILAGINAEVIGVYDNFYKINGVDKKCLTIFTVEDPVLVASPATFTLTGLNVTLLGPPNTLRAESAVYTISGQSATLKSNKIIASPGSFGFTGSSATLTIVRLINISISVSTIYGSRFNSEFSGINETKTIFRSGNGTTSSTMAQSSSVSSFVTKGITGTGVAADIMSIEWSKNGVVMDTATINAGVLVNAAYTFTGVNQLDSLHVEIVEG